MGKDPPALGMSTVDGELHSLRAAVEELQDSAAGKQVADLQAECARMATQITHAQREREEASLAAQERWQRMERRLAAQELATAQLGAALEAQAAAHAEELAAAREAAQARLSQVVDQIADQLDVLGAGLDAALASQRQRAEGEEGELVALRAQVEESGEGFRAALAALEAGLAELRGGLEGQESSLRALRGEVEGTARDVGTLETRCREEVESVAGEVAALQASLQDAGEGTAAQTRHLEEGLARLEAAHEANTASIASLAMGWAGGLDEVCAEAEALSAELQSPGGAAPVTVA